MACFFSYLSPSCLKVILFQGDRDLGPPYTVLSGRFDMLLTCCRTHCCGFVAAGVFLAISAIVLTSNRDVFLEAMDFVSLLLRTFLSRSLSTA
jgi:hypothetical protein